MKAYAIGWFVTGLVLSVVNDALTKSIAHQISFWQIICIRFGFASLMICAFAKVSAPKNLKLHVLRGALLFVGMGMWCIGLREVSLSVATLIGLTTPVFLLYWSRFYLKESITKAKVIGVGFAVLGMCWLMRDLTLHGSVRSVLALLLASCVFASLDVVNKKMVSTQSNANMMFYSSITTFALSIWPAVAEWRYVTQSQCFILLASAAISNAMFFCFLRAFALADLSTLAALKSGCVEILTAALLSAVVFHERLNWSFVLSSALVVVGLILISRTESTT